jgi:hypothetical protein
MTELSDALAELALDPDEEPVYRSGACGAYAAWATAASALGTDRHLAGSTCEEPTMRCTLPDEWDDSAFHGLDAAPSNTDHFFEGHQHGAMYPGAAEFLEKPLPQLQVTATLTPHRVEGSESLVCSLRQFTLIARIVNAATGAVVPAADASLSLRPSLVFADDGGPVPPSNGEAPLCGEVASKRPTSGESHFVLRATALSYKHARRPFALRIDVDGLPMESGAAFAVSAPVRVVARLPNEARPPHANSTQRCTGVGLGPSCDMTGLVASHSARRPPAVPTVAAEESLMVEQEDEEMEEEEEAAAGSEGALVHEMREQSDTIQALLSQQRQMLEQVAMERARLHALGQHTPPPHGDACMYGTVA